MRSTCQRLTVGLVVLAFWGLSLASASYADGESSTSGEGSANTSNDSNSATQDSSSSSSLGPLSKLTIHGFLSQAYTTAKFTEGGPTLDEKTLGVPEDGTFDYRTLAIQFRYEISPKDIMTIQFSSRSLGQSPIEVQEDEVELDWAFYERRIRDNTSFKIGRVQLPLGIFNEIRDVGTILPFWRPSFALYREGTFTSETVDGIVLSHIFAAQSDWSLEADFYYGEWELLDINPSEENLQAFVARASDAFGYQLWLNTPLPSLRFGLAGFQMDVSGGNPGLRLPTDNQRQRLSYLLSVDYNAEKFVARGEYTFREHSASSILFGTDLTLWYAQIGYHPTERWRVYLQYEEGEGYVAQDAVQEIGGPPLTNSFRFSFRTDLGLALSYSLSPNVVFKLEHHLAEGGAFVFEPTSSGLRPVITDFDNGEYTILSLSASF